MVDSTTKGPWQNLSTERRQQVLATVHTCGSQRQTWACTAALIGISERQLRTWKAGDPEGKIVTAYETGKQETASIVAKRMIELAEERNPEILKHMSKHFLGMSDKSTQTVVTPSDLAGGTGSDAKARRRAALAVLGLEALAPEE